MDVPGERAQARNLGGTAKQPFALNEGGRLFFTLQDVAQSIVQRAPDGLVLLSRSEVEAGTARRQLHMELRKASCSERRAAWFC